MTEDIDKGEISDGYHTFNELYDFRKMYNAALVNTGVYESCKSIKHSDGLLCFGGGWFIVMMDLPTGQISNHYEMKDWDLFKCKEVDLPPVFDGHTNQDVLDRLKGL